MLFLLFRFLGGKVVEFPLCNGVECILPQALQLEVITREWWRLRTTVTWVVRNEPQLLHESGTGDE